MERFAGCANEGHETVRVGFTAAHHARCGGPGLCGVHFKLQRIVGCLLRHDSGSEHRHRVEVAAAPTIPPCRISGAYAAEYVMQVVTACAVKQSGIVLTLST